MPNLRSAGLGCVIGRRIEVLIDMTLMKLDSGVEDG